MFLFCNYGKRENQTIEGLLRSLLRQLAEQCASIPEPVETLYASHTKNENTKPLSCEEVFNTLSTAIGTRDPVFIVVDALDECSDEARTELLKKTRELQKVAKASLLATSRHIHHIEQHFEEDAQLEIRADEEDVAKYVSSQLVNLPSCVKKNPTLQEKIKRCIAKTVDGM